MNSIKRIVAMVVAIAMCVTLSSAVWAANDIGVTYSATIDTPTIAVSSEAQTVTVTIKTSEEVSFDGIGGKIIVPDGFTVDSVVSVAETLTFEYSTKNNAFTSDNEDGENITSDTLMVITYTVPADAAAGEYVLGLENGEITFDYGEVWEDSATVTATLTIEEPVSYASVNLMGTLSDWGTGVAMTTTDGVTYTHTMELASGTYEFKIKIGDSWYGNNGTINDSNDGPWTMDGGNNCKLVASGGTYTFTYNLTNNTIKIDAELDESAHTHSYVMGVCECGETLNVNLMGTLSDWATGTVMSWVDNDTCSVTLELAVGTYEFKIKVNNVWYGNGGTINDTTNGNTWTMDSDANCTLVATGGSYTFTYNYNANTVKVDAVLPHTHSYENVVYTWDNYYTSCTVTGTCASTVGECTAPNLSADCTISASTNDYGDLVFTASYGTLTPDSQTVTPADSRAIYFDNTNSAWSNVNAYCWNDAGDMSTWPGTAMTKVEGEDNLYVAIIPAGYVKIIFNDGNEQTDNLTLPTEGENIGVWYANNNVKWGYNVPSKHTITFVYGAGSDMNQEYYYGETIFAVPEASWSDDSCTTYTFTGWKDQNGNLFDSETIYTVVTGDATYTAQYSSVTEHTPNADDGDCTTDITCSVCGTVTTEGNASHTPNADDGDCTTDITCSVCGTVTTEGNASHTPNADDGDCTTDITCSVCGTVTTEGNASHTPNADDGDCTTDITCSVCGTTTTEGNAAHTPNADDGDCTTDITCSICGTTTTEGNATHTPNADATCTTDQVCTVCGDILTEKLGHEYVKQDAAWYQDEDGHYCYGEVEICDNNADHVNYYPVTGITRVPYPTVAINGVTYAPNADDLAYWEANQDTSSYTDAETALFIFDEDGKFQFTTGMVTYNEATRYAVNGMIGWHVGLVEVDGDYYYFKGDVNGGGNIMATGNVYATRDHNSDLKVGTNVIYTFGADGKLCGYTGITEVSGVLYYYNTDHSLALGAGLIQVDDAYYYVRNDAKLVVGTEYWVANNNGYDVAVGMYEFDETGKLIIPEVPEVLDGIVDIDGVLYYYKQGVKQSGAGVVELTDENGETFYIYVRSNGQLATGIYWPTTLNGLLTAGAYNWGEDGKYYPSNPNVIVEIRDVNGTLYYYENGMKIPGKGVVQMTDENGETYYIYVRSNGALATGIYWPSTRNGLLERGAYDWGTDGRYYPTEG